MPDNNIGYEDKLETEKTGKLADVLANDKVKAEAIKIKAKSKAKPKAKSKTIADLKGSLEGLKPGEWREVDTLVPKSLSNTDQDKFRDNVSDVVIFGEDLFKLLSKASSKSEGWMKSTKAYDVSHGCLVQVTTQQKNLDGSYAVAEALTFVPGVRVTERRDTSGTVVSRSLAARR